MASEEMLSFGVPALRVMAAGYLFMWLLTRFWGMTGVWFAFPCAEIVTCICCVCIILKTGLLEKTDG